VFDEEKTIKAVEKVSPSVVAISTQRVMRYDFFNKIPVEVEILNPKNRTNRANVMPFLI